MKRVFLLYHGFAFTSDFWQPLLPFFSNEQVIVVEEGYYGAASFRNKPYDCVGSENIGNFIDPGTQVIGIGHSHGLLCLLRSKINFFCLIGLHAFLNFLGNDPLILKRRNLEYRAFLRRLRSDHITSVRNFLGRCGVDAQNFPPIEKADRAKLLQGAEDLVLPYLNSLPCRLAVVNSDADPTVPRFLTDDNFGGKDNIALHKDGGMGHVSAMHNAAQTADIIRNFVNEVSKCSNKV